jgi:DNA repair exonuclease SbcCD ATPase subunit
MDDNNVTTILIGSASGLFVSVATAFVGYLINRRKQKKELKKMDIDIETQIRDDWRDDIKGWREHVSELNKKFDDYQNKTEIKIEKLQTQVDEWRTKYEVLFDEHLQMQRDNEHLLGRISNLTISNNTLQVDVNRLRKTLAENHIDGF